jgi:hypothetical protein
VQLVQNDVGSCLKPDSPADLEDLYGKATAAVTKQIKPGHESEAAESNLDLAEQLWQVRSKDCQPPPSQDSALALVLKRLAR